MLGIVLDCSSLIPCSEKPEEMKRAIQDLGHILYNLNCAVVYFSPKLVRIYHRKVEPLLRRYCQQQPLPPFQAGLLRSLPVLMRIVESVRSLLCEVKQTKEGLRFHVLETSYVQSYEVNDLGLKQEDDKEVLRIALAATSKHKKVFLVTADRHLLEVNRAKIMQKYPHEAQRLEIVAPDDQNLMNTLVTLTSLCCSLVRS